MSEVSIQSHPTFISQGSRSIDSLGINVLEFEHKVTGAKHFHIESDLDENVFLVALRTVPTDSTGVAHILEHTALCGSKKYPVRDPFFMMIRRSLNTFMNAFTSSDWTAYPFASQNKKDFNNLLDVYLDAVFFSRLDELDFLQEGHRLEFSDKLDSESELEFKGVVYNEMKGAMSSVSSILWQTVTKYLYPTTTYHHNSGGEPEHIVDLSYDELKDFYKTHYHPSNAVFMTFGNISHVEHQEKFEQQALGEFSKLDEDISVEDEKRYFAPVSVVEHYGVSSEDEEKDQTHHVVGWLLGQSINLEQQLESQFLSNLLLDNSASPLRALLEKYEHAASPSPLCGLEDSNKEMSFFCGVEGSNPEFAEDFENKVLELFEKLAKEGVDQGLVEATLHQLEISQREISGDGYPYGLQLILSSLGAAIHNGDVLSSLDLDPALEQLKSKCEDKDFIPSLINRLILNNQHRVRLSLAPNAGLNERKVESEKLILSQIKSQLSESDKQDIVAKAKALEERQLQKDDESILPKVTLSDVSETIHFPTKQESQIGAMPLSFYEQGTNGLVYFQQVFQLPNLSEEEISVLPLFTSIITELGCGDMDYLETQSWQSSVCGTFSAYSTIRGELENEQNSIAYVTFTGKALASKAGDFAEMVVKMLQEVRFDEYPRLRDMIAQIKARKENSVTGNGHGLAMSAAVQAMSPAANINHNVSGLQSIISIRDVAKQIDSDEGAQKLMSTFRSIRDGLLGNQGLALIISDKEHLESVAAEFNSKWQQVEFNPDGESLTLNSIRETVNQFWATNAQVSFCAKAYPTVPANHADAPALAVLGGFLRNGYLHTAIREQGGAYGAGAGQDSNVAAFRFYTYRDPRIEGSLEDFDKSIDWLLETDHDDEKVEQAILGVIGQLDKPASPAGEAKHDFHNWLSGRNREYRIKARKALLTVTQDDLKRVAATYLKDKEHSTVVVSGHNQKDKASELGLELKEL